MKDQIARLSVAALLATLLAACGGDVPASENTHRPFALGRRDETSSGTVDLGSESYHPAAMKAVGNVVGNVRLDGAPPADTTKITTDAKVCQTISSSAVETGGHGELSNTIVWIADAKSGKALPMDKR
ncbi:MAG: hypothetical protein ACREBE_11450, partial [bacterium]